MYNGSSDVSFHPIVERNTLTIIWGVMRCLDQALRILRMFSRFRSNSSLQLLSQAGLPVLRVFLSQGLAQTFGENLVSLYLLSLSRQELHPFEAAQFNGERLMKASSFFSVPSLTKPESGILKWISDRGKGDREFLSGIQKIKVMIAGLTSQTLFCPLCFSILLLTLITRNT